MREFYSVYDFYRLPEGERIALVGSHFVVRPGKTVYFPVRLAEGEFNYGVQQGLVFVTPVLTSLDCGKWFRVGVESPDDLDIDLDFGAADTWRRQEVIDFLKTTNKVDVTYRGLLARVRDRFDAGEFTS
jgi:hypothetical protein